ncbi:MAG: DNA mismatch repair endonuclease MutL [Candidatus Woesearchaeota archaeon]
MGIINRLEQHIIEKIAAGEVVQNPASVVKELVENSLDAHATAITISLKQAGKESIRVDDNGIGMSPEDALLAVERHATSKIKTADDLTKIKTLGFRGEALASIAAVSKLTLRTCQQQSTNAIALSFEAGNLRKQEPAAANPGTSIEVKHLFFNTPARKKYLKSDTKETALVFEVVSKYALAYPSVSFKLIHNQKTLLSVPKAKNLKERIESIYGSAIAKELLEVTHAQEYRIYGFISKPNACRPDKTYQTLLINKRWVKNQLLSKAVEEAYQSLLFHGKHPLFVLNIELLPTEIDVNVHPQKTTIKIAEESKVYKALLLAVRQTLKENNLLPTITCAQLQQSLTRITEDATAPKQEISPNEKKTELGKPSKTMATKNRYGPSSQTQRMLDQDPFVLSNQEGKNIEASTMMFGTREKKPIQLLGQVHKTYILAETAEGILLLDQHAAHERILFEKLKHELEKKKPTLQTLVEPLLIEMTTQEWLLFKQQEETIRALGFQYEQFGKQSIILRQIPLLLGKLSVEDYKALLGSLTLQKNIEQHKERALATMACRAAIKAGESLTLQQQKLLLEAMKLPAFPYSCPHGRPTTLFLSFNEIEKLFKRKE